MACSTCASTKWPIRHLAITGIDTAAMMPSIMSGSLMRATPPWALMSAGTRSSAITATAPASSAIFACSASTTSMITPPLSISARPLFTRIVPSSCTDSMLAVGLALALCGGLLVLLLRSRHPVGPGRFQPGSLAVGKHDDDHRLLIVADDQAVGVDDVRVFVVLAVLGTRGQDAVADLVGIVHAANYRL